MLFTLILHLLCLLAGYFNITVGKIVHITPSPGLLCPQQNCYTLTQFLALSNFSSNTTLYFLPGTHSLQSEPLIRNISELNLVTLSDTASETTAILCGSTAKLLIENVHLVRLSHLYFIGCSGIKIESVHKLIINSSNFHGLQNTNETVLELVYSNAEIINSSFLFNQHGSYRGPIRLLQFLILQQQIPPQSPYALVGGALIVNSSNVSAAGSRFEGNVAEIGGAIFSVGSSSIILTNCVLVGNHAFNSLTSSSLCFGGAIYSEFSLDNSTYLIATYAVRANTMLVNTTFINNTASTEGGAIVTFSTPIAILKCRFITNSALSGGALMVTKCNVTIYDSYFNMNDAYYTNGGGVIHANIESIIGIARCRFYDNIALTGCAGVLLANTLSNITVRESVFHNNSAQTTGGVIAISLACELIIMQCRFSNNMASQGGVILAEFQSEVTMMDSDFINNAASAYGGVVNVQDDSVLVATNTVFKDNIAHIGGVLMQNRNSLALSLVNDSFFHNNSATTGGVFASIQSGIKLLNCEFIDNVALIVGGVGAAKQHSFVNIIASSAFNNTANVGGVLHTLDYCYIHVEGSQFNSCKALLAGGIFATVRICTLIVEDCEFENNTSYLYYGGAVFISNNSFASVNRTHFGFNKANGGGAFHLEVKAHVAISECDFSENSAIQRGGAIDLIIPGNTLLLVQTTFKNNSASLGGAISIDANATAVIEESTFTGNRANMGGTLLLSLSDHILIANTNISESFANLGSVFLTGCKIYFTQNVAITSNFGSIYMINSHLNLLGNSTFKNNVLSNSANEIKILKLIEEGTITIFRGGILIGGTTFFNNNTAENGAAIHATHANIYVSKPLIITNNTATYNGGGLYLYQSQMLCQFNCSLTLTGNRALNNGGGIYAVSSTIDVTYYRGLDYLLPTISFIENKAKMGGGLSMKANAKLYILKTGHQANETAASCCSVVFSNNFADYGGAIFVDDGTNVGVCDSNPHQASSLIKKRANYTECFLQVIDLIQLNLKYTSTSIVHFSYNHALYAGSTLFGGLLDRCIASSFAEIYLINNIKTPNDKIHNGVSYFKAVSNLLEETVISHPVTVCFHNNSQPDCGYKLPMKLQKKGERISQWP